MPPIHRTGNLQDVTTHNILGYPAHLRHRKLGPSILRKTRNVSKTSTPYCRLAILVPMIWGVNAFLKRR